MNKIEYIERCNESNNELVTDSRSRDKRVKLQLNDEVNEHIFDFE